MKRQLLLLTLAGGLIAGAVPARAQSWQNDQGSRWQDRDDREARDRDRERWRDHRAYQDGYRDGQRDRGKRFHPRGAQWKGEDRNIYNAGYRAGFNGRGDLYRDRDGYRDRDRDRDGIPDRVEGDYRRGGSQAYRNGHTDGLWYGQHDAQARKPFKPTDSNAYEKATAGYNTSYGSVDEYKREYRRGYQEGYQRGYYGR